MCFKTRVDNTTEKVLNRQEEINSTPGADKTLQIAYVFPEKFPVNKKSPETRTLWQKHRSQPCSHSHQMKYGVYPDRGPFVEVLMATNISRCLFSMCPPNFYVPFISVCTVHTLNH